VSVRPGGAQRCSQLVTVLGCERVPVGQVAKDGGTVAFVGLVAHAWHDVNVEVCEAFGLGEQHDVRLLTAGHRLERNRRLAEQTAELDSLVRSQLIEGVDVAQRCKDQPAFQARVEVVRHAPATPSDEAFAKRSPAAGLLAGVAPGGHDDILTEVARSMEAPPDGNCDSTDAGIVPLCATGPLRADGSLRTVTSPLAIPHGYREFDHAC
jgi:hypothetical protein